MLYVLNCTFGKSNIIIALFHNLLFVLETYHETELIDAAVGISMFLAADAKTCSHCGCRLWTIFGTRQTYKRRLMMWVHV